MALELLIKPAKFKEAVDKLGKKKRIAKKLTSKQWSQVPTALRERAFFSANVENAKFLQKAQKTLTDYIAGAREYVINQEGKKVLALKKTSRADFVYDMAKMAKESGMGDVLPPGVDRESRDIITKIKDIQSEARLRLIFDTQTSQAQAYGYYKQGQDPAILDEYPAQRFIRAEGRMVPRPLHRKNRNKVKRKDDISFWLRMNSKGIGGFGVPWGPWGFNSGMDVEDVDRDEAVKLGLIKEDEFIEQPDEKFNETLKASTKKMPTEIEKKLKQKLGKKAKFVDGQVNFKSEPPPPPPVIKRRRGAFPSLGEIKPVRNLGGSTGAQLVEDDLGERFVMKTGASAEHLLSEAAADDAYRVLGFDVPTHTVWESDRPTKLAKFVKGKSLKSFLKGATPAQATKVKKQIQDGFVADALLGNWDVVGLEADNILVDNAGKIWRIDNGGALGFRAQGAKKTAAQWGAKVDELDTLLDPRLNPQTAKMFEGITDDEILKQIDDISEKKAELLKALPEADRAVVKDRIKNLEQFADKRSGPITETVAKKAKESRGYGYAVNMDKGDIEDTQVLAWQSKGKNKKPQTNLEMRLTPETADKVADLFKGAKVAEGTQLASIISKEWDEAFTSAAKSINFHTAKGKAPNLKKIKALDEMMEKVGDAMTKGDISINEWNYYNDYYGKVKKAVDGKTKVAVFKPRNIKPPVKAPSSKALEILKNPVIKDDLVYPKQVVKKGNIESSPAGGNHIIEQITNFEAEVDGVKVKFVPVTGVEKAGYSFQGSLQLEIDGTASKETLDKGRKVMRKLGIDTSKPSKAYEEALYISKNLRNEKSDTIEKKAFSILKKADLTDEQKLEQIKSIVPAKFKRAMGTKAFKPEGRASTFGVGRRVQERMDLPFDKMAKQMEGYTLTHESSMKMDSLVDLMLENGGMVSSITDRKRLGATWRGGQSARRDVESGVGNYFFTRIRKKKNVTGRRIAFKVGNLARLDAQPFHKDWAGGVTRIGRSERIRRVRKKTVSEFKKIAEEYGNETLFKHGLNLLDDVEHFYTSELEAGKILKVFKDHKIDKLPDGRSVRSLFIDNNTGEPIFK